MYVGMRIIKINKYILYVIITSNMLKLTAAGNPAMPEYAKACGITVSPTVMPATMSPMASSQEYFGSQPRIGTLLISVFFLNVRLEQSFNHLLI